MKEKLLFLLFFCALAAAALFFAWRAAPAPVVEKPKASLTTRLTQAASDAFIPWTGSTQPGTIADNQNGSCPPGSTYFTSDPAQCLVDGTLVPAAPTQSPHLVLPVPPAEP